MQSKFKTSIMVFAVAFACAFAAKANAECGDLSKLKVGATFHRQSWRGFGSSPASLLLVADSGEPIVGLWKFTMTSEGTTGIPDGTVVDQGFSQWHSDGTEVTVSGNRAPVTGDVCLGAWKTTGGLHYGLSHYGISYDTNNNFVGLAHITEKVAVSPGGKTFAGTFTIDQFDQSGNTLAHITGQITGTRITADSPTIVAF
jgi:hypothetical protein